MSKPTRFPSVPPSQQNEEQKAIDKEAERVVLESFGPSFKLRDDDGTLLGPFAPLFYTPDSFIPYLRHVHATAMTPHFAPRERELATLAVGAVTQAEYVLYAHSRIALSLGLSKKQVDDAVQGKVPRGLSERETVIYEFALVMANSYGKLDDRRWESGKQMFGREKMAALIQIVAMYLHSSCVINAAEIRSPDGKEEQKSLKGSGETAKEEQKTLHEEGSKEKDWEVVEGSVM